MAAMMDEKDEVLRDAVLVQLMYLNAKAHGVVAGLLGVGWLWIGPPGEIV
jgi:hypothetical protein